MKISLIRHTSLSISPDICYGQSDIDVSPAFDQECITVQDKLNPYQFDAIYTSPLQRCVKLAVELNLDNPAHDHRLKELNFGSWELQNWSDIPREQFDEWANDYANQAPPKGETFAELQQRGLHFLEEMRHVYSGGHIAAVSHGGMIRALLAHTLNIPLKSLFRFAVDYASVTTLDFSHEIPKVLYVNR